MWASPEADLSALGHGGLCLGCGECRYPVCPFGKGLMMDEPRFNHFDGEGNAIMVDVSPQSPTHREAVAAGKIKVSCPVLDAITGHTAAKGDVLGVAGVAGIMQPSAPATSSPLPPSHALQRQGGLHHPGGGVRRGGPLHR